MKRAYCSVCGEVFTASADDLRENRILNGGETVCNDCTGMFESVDSDIDSYGISRNAISYLR